MSTLTIRLPDDIHRRLKERLMEELSTVTIAQYDGETRFRVLAARG